MADASAIVLRRLIVRAQGRAEGEAAAASFAAAFTQPLDGAPGWDAGPRASIALQAPAGGAGATAARALRGRIGGGHG